MLDRISSPTLGSPRRRAGSTRRTTTIDIVNRPDGGIVLTGRARDVRTPGVDDGDGAAVVRAEAEVRAALAADRTLEALDVEPADGNPDALVGALVGRGFRDRAATAFPDVGHRPLGQLVDDLPVAALIAGYAVVREAARTGVASPYGDVRTSLAYMADVCSGWRSGGTLLTAVEAGQGIPLQDCPVAPPLADPDDPAGWHDVGPMPPGTMRRARRIDVGPGSRVEVDAMFRDSYGEPDRDEVVLHEYELRAVVDRHSLVVLDIEAIPRVLPYGECPAAAASAAALRGRRLDDVPDLVRRDFVGTGTCTHLNDLLRSLVSVPVLVPD